MLPMRSTTTDSELFAPVVIVGVVGVPSGKYVLIEPAPEIPLQQFAR